MKYIVPVLGKGAGFHDIRRPAYVELLGAGTVVEDRGEFFVVEVNSGAPKFEPCQARSHDELLKQQGVTFLG